MRCIGDERKDKWAGGRLDDQANRLTDEGEMARMQKQIGDLNKLIWYWKQKFAKEEERKKKWVYL